MFVGVHERQLDDKGRIALPPTFRGVVDAACYLVYGKTGCIELYSTDVFDDIAREYVERVRRGEVSLNAQRAFASSASLVTLDKQGRITIDERLRRFAGIEPGERVVLAGNLIWAEIWSQRRHEEVDLDGRAQIAATDGQIGSIAFPVPATSLRTTTGSSDRERGREDPGRTDR